MRALFAPDEVRLVVEVVSPESARRDRTVKLRKYAEAGIPHYWCIEEEDGVPVVHVYKLDEPTHAYAPVGIFRGTLQRPVPFEIVSTSTSSLLNGAAESQHQVST